MIDINRTQSCLRVCHKTSRGHVEPHAHASTINTQTAFYLAYNSYSMCDNPLQVCDLI